MKCKMMKEEKSKKMAPKGKEKMMEKKEAMKKTHRKAK